MVTSKGKNRYIIGLGAILLGIVIAVGLALYSISGRASAPRQTVPENTPTTPVTMTTPDTSYVGAYATVADAFSVKVPGGWHASISNAASFTAIMFARPNQLQNLTYDATIQPVIDQDGIPAWSGLTEHFFILAPTAANQFTPSNHLEISSEPFTFDDGTVGTKYYVVKHADEAKKWGGLQRDTEWQGRTYIYESNGRRVEAHLALYPSTTVDVPFYESIVRTIRSNLVQ